MTCNDCPRTLNCPPCPYEDGGPEGVRRHENGAPCDSKECDRYHVFDEPAAPKAPPTPLEDGRPYKPTRAGERTMPLAQQRRPPYAVAYAVGGAEAYEVLVPGDATVMAVDGHLEIRHPGEVQTILQVKPYLQESNG